MKTYFKYEGIIKSKEAAEAIAAPSGLGPFCGFGSATINGNKLVVSPQGVAGSKYANVIKDRIMARYMAKNQRSPANPSSILPQRVFFPVIRASCPSALS